MHLVAAAIKEQSFHLAEVVPAELPQWKKRKVLDILQGNCTLM